MKVPVNPFDFQARAVIAGAFARRPPKPLMSTETERTLQ